jgi:uncharacterized iron-regulated protein
VRAIFSGLVLVININIFAVSNIEANKIYSEGEEVELSFVLEQVKSGSVVIISEDHNTYPHQQRQLLFLNKLRKMYPDYKINVGLEFLKYPNQDVIDSYKENKISESEFIVNAHWPKNRDYSDYRPLVNFPQVHLGETTVGLNAPKWLPKKIKNYGLESLSHIERSYLPPNFTLGNKLYYERLKEFILKIHDAPEDMLIDYFTAQSVWDDSMAWMVNRFMKAHPEEILIVIVGEFHSIYGGGLPDRIKARGHKDVINISQFDIDELTHKEILTDTIYHPRWGRRADYVWTSGSNGSKSKGRDKTR